MPDPTPPGHVSPEATRFALIGLVAGIVIAFWAGPESGLALLGALAGLFWVFWKRAEARLGDLDARLERLESERLGGARGAVADPPSRLESGGTVREEAPFVPEARTPEPETHIPEALVPEARTPDAERPATERPQRDRAPARQQAEAPRRRRHAESASLDDALSSLGDVAMPLRRAYAFATGGNPLVRVALLILFVGIGLGLRYAAQQGFFPVETRLGVAGAFGAALVALGWRVRERNPSFGLAVQGGGVAVLYLTVYAAYALFGLIVPVAAIAMMAGVSLLCAGLAVSQSAPGLAVLGVAGGFAAPVLAGTADGSYLLLLSYYAVLNLGVLGIAWTRAWRSVALVGFVGTFLTGGLWGGLSYAPAMYATVQPFLILSFAVYFALAIRFAMRSAQEPERTLGIDGALVFGLPAATFVLQAGLVEGILYGRAVSAAALAAIYLGSWLLVRHRGALRLLSDAFLAIGLVFATLALPLAFTRVAFGAMWVLEGAALVWVGARQGKAWMRASGLALQLAAAGVLFTEGVVDLGRAFSPETLTGWIVAVALGITAYVLHRWRASVSAWERAAGAAALAFGMLWWAVTAHLHVLRLAPDAFADAILVGAIATSALLFIGIGRALAWPALRAWALLAIPLAGAVWLALVLDGTPPHAHGGFVAWPALFGAALLAVRGSTTDAPGWRPIAYASLVWLATAVGSHEASALLPDGSGWAAGAAGLGIAAALAWTARASATAQGERPLTVWGLTTAATMWAALIPLLVAGRTPGLRYLPVLNPLDVATVALVVTLVLAGRGMGRDGRATVWTMAGASALVGLAAAVARSAHWLSGVAYDAEPLWASVRFQAPLAVVWTLLALGLTLWGARRLSRPLWFFGVSVLALVVAKLFFVDLAQARALEVVAAFVVVGVLVLVVGYRSPLPPKRASAVTEAPSEPDADL